MAKKTEPKLLDVALQGGGSHGAFTWGVLERLLEDDRIQIEGLCGTSAGAMNAVMVAHGLQKGGRQGAIDLLHKFWKRISDDQAKSGMQPSLLDKLFGNGEMSHTPAYHFFEFLSHILSPYEFNPFNMNPLRDVLEELVDFDQLTSCKETKLYVCATNVRTSRPKVFPLEEISVDAVLASACLPTAFQTVEIDGEGYWDGGFMGNPPLFPLIDGTTTEDILIVQINPVEIDNIPKSADEIRDRINELNFNASLMLEMRRVAYVQRLLKEGHDLGGNIKDLHIHLINPTGEFAKYGVSSKSNADWKFLRGLHKEGYEYAEDFLKNHYEEIGKDSSCNLREVYL